MSAQKIINAFSYLLENNPELTAQNQDSIHQLCQGKNNLDGVVAAIGKWCKERGIYGELLELNKTELPTTGDRAILGKPNANVQEVNQLLDNISYGLNPSKNANNESNKNDNPNQSQSGTKKS